MSQIFIKKCSQNDIKEFSNIMLEAFHDKYSNFFKGVHPAKYRKIVSDLNNLEIHSNNNLGKFVLCNENKCVGAIEIYNTRKKLLIIPAVKIMLKYLGVFLTIKIGLMLLGFGPPIFFPKNTIYIDKVGVKKDFRGKGFGKNLMKFALKIAEKNRYQNVMLEVVKKNYRAINLYKKLGFQIIKTTKTKLGEIFVGVTEYHLMKKML
ncbi:MAG: GNAT family N-acetyltransferase [Candidatus Thorarchaeota archaeon]